MTARPNPAVRGEPRGIGTAGARDPLAREVRLLGSLLGQVIVEQEGLDLLELVERVRRRTIALRRAEDPVERAKLSAELDSLDLPTAESVIRSFGLYFQLVNLAEERHRVRTLRRRERAARGGILDDSVAEAVRRIWRTGRGVDDIVELIGRLSIAPVLTAHPTEARRRTLLVALRRCHRLVERLDDPRLTPDEDRDIRRRLREEISLLWRTADLRSVTPTPLDEVRTAMTYFDETLFTVAPRLYRAARRRPRPARHGGAAASPRSDRPAGRDRPDGSRCGAYRNSSATRAGLPPLGQLDRRRPRRQPGGDRRDDRTRAPDPRRSRDPWLRGSDHPADADDRPDRATIGRPGAAGQAARGRRRCAPGDDAPAPAALPRRTVPPAVRGDRRATPEDEGGPDRGFGRPGRRALPRPGGAAG